VIGDASWGEGDLRRVRDAIELQLASARTNGTLRPYVTRWVVRAGNQLYVRSAYRPDNPWYRRAIAAYHTKYDHYGPTIVGTVVGSAAHRVTLRFVQASGGE